jgi:hypothetical protein
MLDVLTLQIGSWGVHKKSDRKIDIFKERQLQNKMP